MQAQLHLKTAQENSSNKLDHSSNKVEYTIIHNLHLILYKDTLAFMSSKSLVSDSSSKIFNYLTRLSVCGKFNLPLAA